MQRVGLVLFVLALLATPTGASGGTVGTGDIHIHTWSGGSDGKILPEGCPDDVFFVTATLRLINPSPVDQVTLTVDHAGPNPLGVANAASPLTSATVQLGGCDRTFNAVVTGLLVLKTTRYELTFS